MKSLIHGMYSTAIQAKAEGGSSTFVVDSSTLMPDGACLTPFLLPLTRRAADLLKARLDGEYVFPLDGDQAKPMGKINNAHNAALKRSGLPHFRLYDLRHTFATRAAEAGVDLVTLAALLGHSKIQMVLRYAHPQAEHKAQAIRKMEEFQMAKQMEEAAVSELVQ